MSIRTACYVACDHCGDPAPVTTDGADSARREAMACGWRRTPRDAEGRRYDLCHRCRDKAPPYPFAVKGRS